MSKPQHMRIFLIHLLLSLILFPTVGMGEESPSLLNKLYKMIWPYGRYKGAFIRQPVINTTKGDSGDLSSIFLFDMEKMEAREWHGTRGALDPTTCPDGKTLLFRRDKAVWFQSINIGSWQGISKLSEPIQVKGITVDGLYACTLDERGQLLIWTWSADKQMKIARFINGSAGWTSLPLDRNLAEEAAKNPMDFLENLRWLRTIRPDGIRIWVYDGQLYKGNPSSEIGTPLVPAMEQTSADFVGVPAWIGNSVLFFVTVKQNM